VGDAERRQVALVSLLLHALVWFCIWGGSGSVGSPWCVDTRRGVVRSKSPGENCNNNDGYQSAPQSDGLGVLYRPTAELLASSLALHPKRLLFSF
jgi:hypothetical protein